MNIKSIALLLLSVLVPLGIGFLGSFATMPAIPGWYAELVKPALNPPSYVFGPVWTLLYVFMGIAAFRVYQARQKNITLATKVLSLYGVHLLVNLSWSLVFFGGQNPEAALAVIALLLAMVAVLTLLFSKVDKMAGLLFVPYLAWVSFATYLNASIMQLNP